VTVPLNQAASQSGLPGEWPQALAGPNVSAQISPPGHVVLTLKVNAINQLIKAEGGTQFFPQNLNQVPITVNIPTVVRINAFHPSTNQGYTLTEAGTPSIAVPGHVDERPIVAAIASLPFLPQSVQQTLATLQGNLENTIVYPTSAQTSSVTVQGNSGVLSVLPGLTSLVWVHQGVFNQFTYNGSISSAQFVQEIHQWFP
jgi:hypothetical protein